MRDIHNQEVEIKNRTKVLKFDSMKEFKQWKELEEEATYNTYDCTTTEI